MAAEETRLRERPRAPRVIGDQTSMAQAAAAASAKASNDVVGLAYDAIARISHAETLMRAIDSDAGELSRALPSWSHEAIRHRAQQVASLGYILAEELARADALLADIVSCLNGGRGEVSPTGAA